jgi:hypothetical protein
MEYPVEDQKDDISEAQRNLINAKQRLTPERAEKARVKNQKAKKTKVERINE